MALVSCLSGVVITTNLLYILNVLFCAVTYHLIIISFVQTYLSIQKSNSELLQDEIRTYLMILIRSVNLNEEDLSKAMNDVDKSCSVV